jgi:translation initiation factor IF-3
LTNPASEEIEEKHDQDARANQQQTTAAEWKKVKITTMFEGEAIKQLIVKTLLTSLMFYCFP